MSISNRPKNCPFCDGRQPVKWIYNENKCYHCDYPFEDEEAQTSFRIETEKRGIEPAIISDKTSSDLSVAGWILFWLGFILLFLFGFVGVDAGFMRVTNLGGLFVGSAFMISGAIIGMSQRIIEELKRIGHFNGKD